MMCSSRKLGIAWTGAFTIVVEVGLVGCGPTQSKRPGLELDFWAGKVTGNGCGRGETKANED